MSNYVYEAYNSRRLNLGWNKREATTLWLHKGSTTEAEAEAAFRAEVPLTFSGLRLDTLDISERGGTFWEAEAKYSPYQSQQIDGGLGDDENPPPEPGTEGGAPEYGDSDPLGNEWSFDMSGTTKHIKQSRFTRSKTRRNGGLAADNKRAIGVTLDGQVQGCDIIEPGFEYTVTVTVAFLTRKYLRTLRDAVGTTNDAQFHGFDSGEILLMGVSGQSKDNGKFTLTFKLKVAPNEFNIDICGDGSLIVPAKRGHEYLWVSYKNVEDANQLFMQPDAAYVEVVYKSSDFTLLKIGV